MKRWAVKCRNAGFLALAATIAVTRGLGAPTGAAAADPANVSIELNKLEPYDKGCRAYIVINNPAEPAYQSFKLDLVVFQTDGVIGRRFALDLAPVKAAKRTVKLFDLDGMACEKIGSFLLNDVMECKADAGALTDCLGRVSVSSLTTVKLSK